MIDKKNIKHWCESVENTFNPRKEVPRNERPKQVNEQFLAYAIFYINALANENEKLEQEIVSIKETFENAISAKRSKGGQQVPYHGDFANIAPSTIREFEFWIKRWIKVLEE